MKYLSELFLLFRNFMEVTVLQPDRVRCSFRFGKFNMNNTVEPDFSRNFAVS